MEKRALLVGIDTYNKFAPLKGCVEDVRAMEVALESHEDGTPNYDCEILISEGGQQVTRQILTQKWSQLFDNFEGDVIFYFSGHGTPTNVGGYLVTQEGVVGDWGLPMENLLRLANKSRAQSILLILDCCYSGDIGNVANSISGSIENQALLRQGLTILAASRSTETAALINGRSVFTNLLLGALSGGAADTRGLVSAASIYAYAEQALGAWQQRPIYKSHADKLPPVRKCKAPVSDELLRQLPDIFSKPDSEHEMNPSYEETNTPGNPNIHKYVPPPADANNVALFKKFKVLRNARLLETCNGEDLFWVAMDKKSVRLTPIGQFYWQLAKNRRIKN